MLAMLFSLCVALEYNVLELQRCKMAILDHAEKRRMRHEGDENATKADATKAGHKGDDESHKG